MRPLGEAALIFTRPSTMLFQYITGFPVGQTTPALGTQRSRMSARARTRCLRVNTRPQAERSTNSRAALSCMYECEYLIVVFRTKALITGF